MHPHASPTYQSYNSTFSVNTEWPNIFVTVTNLTMLLRWIQCLIICNGKFALFQWFPCFIGVNGAERWQIWFWGRPRKSINSRGLAPWIKSGQRTYLHLNQCGFVDQSWHFWLQEVIVNVFFRPQAHKSFNLWNSIPYVEVFHKQTPSILGRARFQIKFRSRLNWIASRLVLREVFCSLIHLSTTTFCWRLWVNSRTHTQGLATSSLSLLQPSHQLANVPMFNSSLFCYLIHRKPNKSTDSLL